LAGYSFIDKVMGELNSSTSNDYHNIIQLSTSEDAYDTTQGRICISTVYSIYAQNTAMLI